MNFMQLILREVTEVTRSAIGNMMRPGVVEQVKGDKIRMWIGNDVNGNKVLSPWLNTANHRGGARERRFYKKGQSMIMFSPSGDPRQAAILPFSPNKDFLAPDHANSSGQDEEVWQLGDLRVKKSNDCYTIFLLSPNKKQQQGELQQLPKQQSDVGKKAKAVIKIHKNGGITARMDKHRFMVNDKGVKMKADKNFAVVTPKELIMSKAWIIAKDPLKDDDKND